MNDFFDAKIAINKPEHIFIRAFIFFILIKNILFGLKQTFLTILLVKF